MKQDGPPPLWFKDALVYQLHVKAFCDSDGDGIGDFKGLTGSLDYLQDLGVTALWLLPFFPSPLKDDGYDIADYRSIHPEYGTLRDFRNFLREAHRRDLRVITELVVNHTSDQHPWFQRARRAKSGSRWRDFYVWSDTPVRYEETRIIFQDFESSNWAWDPVAKAYYWHRFYSHQPDLNYDNPHVRKAILNLLDYWLDMGVDGLRLDAVPYLFEREGTNCENLPETHGFLRTMRAHVDAKHANRILLAEANQWPEDAAAYFGKGDEAQMAFHFPLMPRMFMAIRMENRFPIVDIMEQTPAVDECCQWAIFLRNHDELTLEMVTDEERDYMYRVYAQDPRMRVNLGIRRRLAPLLANNRRRIELMSSLLCSMPGTPILYYGDEIGMGDNFYLGDRNGVRTPMQWSADRNAGFSRANPQKLYLPLITDPEYHYETINVEAQQANPQSLLWWMKRLFLLRKRYRAFSRGSIQFLDPDNYKVLVYVRSYQDEHVLVAANLSRFVQYTELDLSSFAGRVPVEMFGRTTFPLMKEGILPLSFGPHGFYWFCLEPSKKVEGMIEISSKQDLPLVSLSGKEDLPFQKTDRESIEKVLPDFLQRSRWFRSKARSVRTAVFREMVPLEHAKKVLTLGLIQVEYRDGEGETYLLPLMKAEGERAERVIADYPRAVITRLKYEEGREGILFDASVDRSASEVLLDFLSKPRHVRAAEGRIVAQPAKHLARALREAESLEPALIKAEQTNTSIVYGKRFILKLVRLLEEGMDPDLEIGRFLTEKGCDFVPAVLGSLEYDKGKKGSMNLASLVEFVPNQGDAWTYVQDVLRGFLEMAAAKRKMMVEIPFPEKPLAWSGDGEELPNGALEAVGPFVEPARRLGSRTGELHSILASERENPEFTPEGFSTLYQRSLYQSLRNLNGRVFNTLRRQIKDLPLSLKPDAVKVLALEASILDRFRAITRMRITGRRIRCHGDFHLGQVLYTGKDFVIIDFEGEPARPLSERRLKRSPLRDVAGMLRSFQYAGYSALFAQQTHGVVNPDDMDYFEHCLNLWIQWVCRVFLKGYLKAAEAGNFLPSTREELKMLLDTFLLEKAVYEMGYELNNRPDWLKIPFKGLLGFMSGENK